MAHCVAKEKRYNDGDRGVDMNDGPHGDRYEDRDGSGTRDCSSTP